MAARLRPFRTSARTLPDLNTAARRISHCTNFQAKPAQRRWRPEGEDSPGALRRAARAQGSTAHDGRWRSCSERPRASASRRATCRARLLAKGLERANTKARGERSGVRRCRPDPARAQALVRFAALRDRGSCPARRHGGNGPHRPRARIGYLRPGDAPPGGGEQREAPGAGGGRCHRGFTHW